MDMKERSACSYLYRDNEIVCMHRMESERNTQRAGLCFDAFVT